MIEDKNTQVISEVLSKGYFAIVKEKWQKTRGKGAKTKLRFAVGLVGFTLGYAFLRSAVAVNETLTDLLTWLNERKEKKTEDQDYGR